MGETPTNADTMARHLAAEARHDAAEAAACHQPHGWCEHQAFGMRFDGRAAVELQYAASFACMPDLEFHMESELHDGDDVVQCGVFEATLSGDSSADRARGDGWRYP